MLCARAVSCCCRLAVCSRTFDVSAFAKFAFASHYALAVSPRHPFEINTNVDVENLQNVFLPVINYVPSGS